MSSAKEKNQHTDRQRIVLSGSGISLIGKIISHCLQKLNRPILYYDEATVVAEHLPSPLVIFQSASFHAEYAPHIVVATEHTDAIQQYFQQLPKGGIFIFNAQDSVLKKWTEKEIADVEFIPYSTQGEFSLSSSASPVQLASLYGALELAKKIGIPASVFQSCIHSFSF